MLICVSNVLQYLGHTVTCTVLQYLGHTSPELLTDPGRPLNCVSPWVGVEKGVEGDLISAVINQRNIDLDHIARYRVESTILYCTHCTVLYCTVLYTDCRQGFQPYRGTARPAVPPEIHNEHSHQVRGRGQQGQWQYTGAVSHVRLSDAVRCSETRNPDIRINCWWGKKQDS